MRVVYRQAALDDVIRQYRFYLLTRDVPKIAIRFRQAVRVTIRLLRDHPLIGPQYRFSDPRIKNLRSWPIKGFEAIRIYYVAAEDAIHVIRILHGKRNIRRILDNEETP